MEEMSGAPWRPLLNCCQMIALNVIRADILLPPPASPRAAVCLAGLSQRGDRCHMHVSGLVTGLCHFCTGHETGRSGGGRVPTMEDRLPLAGDARVSAALSGPSCFRISACSQQMGTFPTTTCLDMFHSCGFVTIVLNPPVSSRINFPESYMANLPGYTVMFSILAYPWRYGSQDSRKAGCYIGYHPAFLGQAARVILV